MSTVLLPPFWSLVEAHGDELLVHAKRIVGDADAEDVLQDALLRALRAWLYRVTTTTALDHHRSRRREVLTDAPPEQVTQPEHYDDSFEVLIGDLPETARSALRLRFVEDLDYDCIAHRLGTSTVAARQRVSTAIRILRTQGTPA